MGLSVIAAGAVASQAGTLNQYSPFGGQGAMGIAASSTAFPYYTARFQATFFGMTVAQGAITASFTLQNYANAGPAAGNQTVTNAAPTDTTNFDVLTSYAMVRWNAVTGGAIQRIQGLVAPGFVFTDTFGAITITNGAAVGPGPSGVATLNVQKIVPTTATSQHYARWPMLTAVSGSVPYTYQIRLQASGYTKAQVAMNDGAGSAYAVVDLSAGVVTSTGGAVASATLVPAGGGWWFLTIVTQATNGFTTGNTLNAQVFVLDATGANSFAGDGTSGILVTGGQLDTSSHFTGTSLNPPHAANYGANDPTGAATLVGGSTYYTPNTGGTLAGSATEGPVQAQMGSAGKLTWMLAYCGTNTTTASSTLANRVNAATSGVLTTSISAGLTGNFNCGNNPDTVAVADLVDAIWIVGAGGNLVVSQIALTFYPDATKNPNQNDMFAQGSGSPVATNLYYPIYGNAGVGFSADAGARVALGFSFAVTRFAVSIPTNGGTGTSTANVTKNGATVSPTGGSIGPGLTGFIVSGGGFTSYGPTDTVSFFMATMRTGTFTLPSLFTLTLHQLQTYAVSQADAGSAADTPNGYVARTDTVAEAGAGADTPTSVALHPTTVSESGSAADTTDSVAVHPASVSETGAAADTVTSRYLGGNDVVAELGAAADTITNLLTENLSVAESGAASDAVFSQYAPSRDVVAEVLAATDATSSQLTHSGDVVAELGSANDTVRINGVYPSAVIEGAVANEITFSFLGAGQVVFEVGAALDTPLVLSLVTRPALFEAGHAVETPAAGVSRGEAVVEQATAIDFTDGFDLIPLSIIEQGQARDAQIALGSLAYRSLLGMTARVVHRHAVIGGILDDEKVPLLDDQGVPIFEDT